MQLELPDDILMRAEANATDLKLLLALQLYGDNRIDYVDACILSELSSDQLNQELVRRGLPIQQYQHGAMDHRRVV